MGALSAGAAVTQRSGLQSLAAQSGTLQPPVQRVLLVTKCHLDVGFSMTQAKVIRKYFDVYYPQAIATAAATRARGHDRYIWTTGSWLLYEYLEQASASDRKTMDGAIAAGDIVWHALPFNWQTEMLDRSLIEGGLSFSAELDRRYGHTTTGAKMTDVPGHSRGIIAPLQAAGVRLLDIGVNAASTPPDVPDVFLWKDRAGNSLAMLYHRHDYGSTLLIPGTDTAVDVEVRTDNSGPHTLAEIAAIYARLRAQFPGAAVQASNFTEVAAAVDTVRNALPVVTEEIGDTWIYGVASDPVKVARYREAGRRREAWLAANRFQAGDATDRRLLAKLLLAPEHTWGTDTKSYLDNDHYRPADLKKVLGTPNYQVMEVSWQEKRDDISAAIESLPPAMRQEVDAAFAALKPKRPMSTGMAAQDPSTLVETMHYTLGFDSATGALTRLRSRASAREWASAEHPLALFTYQTLSAADYTAFLARYIKTTADWAPRDFGKPNIGSFGAMSHEWHPRLKQLLRVEDEKEERLLLAMQIDDAAAAATGNVAWPAEIFYELRMPKTESRIELTVMTFGKEENRMPEAMWLTFNPVAEDPRGWSLSKVDEQVMPADVVRGGGRSMHAVTGAVRYADTKPGSLQILPLDTPLVAVGERTPLNFSLDLPTLAAGVHFGLYNNAWGTNYLQWCGGNWQSRFSLSV